MSNKPITGNDLLDKLSPIVPNPMYNPKTKKGRSISPFIIDTSSPTLGDDAMSRTMNSVRRLTFTGRELGYTNEDIKRDADLGISLSPYSTDEELNAARAELQSNLTKLGNFFLQAGVGEVVLGTLEGFGNIADGVINTFTKDNYAVNPYTQFMSEAKENLKNKFQIYSRNPGTSWDISDFGWWMNNAVSLTTTASLLLPAAGWTKGIGYVGKATKATKVLNNANKWISRGLAGVNKVNKTNNKFGALKQISGKANRIERTIDGGFNIISAAAISRAGENYMEAKEIYNDVYTKSKENLDNMPDEEFAKFLINNPEFKDMSKDNIAKEIARKSANTTFFNDYAMLLMDIPQFKALGQLWGKTVRRATTASERIAAENARRTLAGKTAEQLIKDNIWNRSKEGIKYALKNPKDSFVALNFGEGFEEMYQGIQSDKGMMVAEKYFNPNMTSRSLSSYLSDGSIWEQGVWGSLGAIVFNKMGTAYKDVEKKLTGLWNKKHMTADEYELWKRSNNKISIEQLNNITSDVDEFISNMQTINEGKNPFNFIVDPETGHEIIKNGELVNEEINDIQAELLKEKAISKFIDNVSMSSIDNGTFALMKDVIGSNEFDQYIANNGLQLDANDKLLSQQIVNRMEDIANIYENALRDVNYLADTTNPFITMAVARNITRNKLKLQEYDDTINNINKQIDQINDSNTDYSNYIELQKYNSYVLTIDKLFEQKENIINQYENNQISKSAYTEKIKNIDHIIKTWNNWAKNNITNKNIYNLLNEFNQIIDSKDNDLKRKNTDIRHKFLKIINEPNNKIGSNDTLVPSETIKELIDKQLEVESKRNYTLSQVPVTQNEYQDIYNEFSRSMDAMEIARRDEYIDLVKNYLSSQDNLDDAIKKIYAENTGNSKVDEALHYLRYLYDSDISLSGKGQFMTNLQLDGIIQNEINKRNKAEKINNEAEKEGVGTLPNEIPQNNNDNSNPPSTGKSQQSNTNKTINTNTTTNTNNTTNENTDKNTTSNQTNSQPTENNTDSKTTINDTNEFDKTEKETKDLNKFDDNFSNPMQVDTSLDPMDSSYDTPSLKGEIKARQYIIQIGFKSEERLNEITEALSKNDTSKRDEFLNEVTNYLVKQGFEVNLAQNIAARAFVSTINLFGAINNQSAFGKLAHQLAIGFSKNAVKKHAKTEMMTDKELDEALNDTVDEFLTEYSNIVNNNSINGKFVINIESLFSYLINNENIDIKTAMYIYNNLSKYISTHNGNKYIFTGFNTSTGYMLSAVDFINQLKEKKAQMKSYVTDLHISPIEYRQRQTKNDAQDYKDALLAAHNGNAISVTIEPQYINTKERTPDGHVVNKKVMSNLNVVVKYKKNRTIKTVKIGILRTVQMSKDGNHIYPIRHQSGFSNKITNTDSGVELDCDFLFNAIINKSDINGEQLWKDIIEYYLNTRIIIDQRRRNEITLEEAQERLKNTMTKEMADRIMNNPYIKQAISQDIYKFDIGVKDNNVAKARDISSKIASILFFGKEEDVNDPTHYNHNSFATDKKTLTERYNDWKTAVKNNYAQTYKFQESIENGDSNPIINSVNLFYDTVLNIIPNNKPFSNIGDLKFDFSKTINGKPNPNYTPFVYVKNGKLIGEDGTDYGEADPMIGDYSMGIIVYKDNNITQVAYFKKTNELKNSDIATKLKDEVRRLIIAQLTNVYDASNPNQHELNFEKIGTLFTELFGYQGLFKLGNYYGEGDISVRITNGGQIINIFHYNKLTKQSKPIMAFFASNSKGNPGHTIRIFGKNYDKDNNKQDYIDINSINDVNKNSNDTVTQWINYALDDIFSSVKLNRSALGFTKKTSSGGIPTVFTWDETTGEFIITLNNEKIVYKNYADFVTTNNGFQINVYQNEDGSFVTRYMNENRIGINAGVRKNVDIPQTNNTAVSDLLYTTEANPKRKTIDTVELLETAGVEQDKIDILLGTNNGLQIVTKRINIAQELGESLMYYDIKNKNINITPKGAMAMNNNPKNAVRLILHENIHRHFNSRSYTNAERQRIIDELQTVYDFVRNKIETDYSNGILNDNLYRQFVNVLDKTQTYKEQQTRMEEFLVECLTQAPLTEWLNNTEYGADADISNINKNKKSILQKIMDIILNLLGIKDSNIKNNSILAREYVILSKGINPTTTKNITIPIQNDNTNSQKILDETKTKIDTIRSDFENRIVRDPNFNENHTYLLDGKPVDFSVTQKIHGKQDIGKWGLPASTLGNTADEAARGYFNNNGVVTDDVQIPNVTDNQREELIFDIMKIEEYLDNKFGKGKYRVITQEFPIGGTVTVNNEIKTIAGTMDMLVYTDTGDIYIYDFKTKRVGNGNGQIDSETIANYEQQVNIYRQILEENYPELKGKIHVGGLIKFNVDYPEPNDTIKYRLNPNNNSQLQISRDGGNSYENIQDALVDYMPPTIIDNADTHNFIIPVEDKDYKDKIGALPEVENININVNDDINKNLNNEDVGLDSEGYIIDDRDFDEDFDDVNLFANTEEILDNVNSSIEIYAPPIANGNNDNAYGIEIVNSINDFINRFPINYQADIKLILDNSELNYTCQ